MTEPTFLSVLGGVSSTVGIIGFGISIWQLLKDLPRGGYISSQMKEVKDFYLDSKEYKKISEAKQRQAKNDEEYSEQFWIYVEDWIRKAELVLAQLHKKVRARIAVAFTIVTANIVHVAIDYPNIVLPISSGSTEIFDFITTFITIVFTIYLLKRSGILEKDEKDLIDNYNKLFLAIYDNRVKGRIAHLNKEYDVFYGGIGHGNKSVRDMVKDLKKIQNDLSVENNSA